MTKVKYRDQGPHRDHGPHRDQGSHDENVDGTKWQAPRVPDTPIPEIPGTHICLPL